MSTGQQCDQRLIHNLVLSEDHLTNCSSHPADARAERFDLGEYGGGIDCTLLRAGHTDRHTAEHPGENLRSLHIGTFTRGGMIPISAAWVNGRYGDADV